MTPISTTDRNAMNFSLDLLHTFYHWIVSKSLDVTLGLSTYLVGISLVSMLLVKWLFVWATQFHVLLSHIKLEIMLNTKSNTKNFHKVTMQDYHVKRKHSENTLVFVLFFVNLIFAINCNPSFSLKLKRTPWQFIAQAPLRPFPSFTTNHCRCYNVH